MTQHERLTETEVLKLRAHFSGPADSNPLNVRIVAEAVGLPEETVREHLRVLRQERAMLPTTEPRSSVFTGSRLLAACACSALLVAGYVTWRRLDIPIHLPLPAGMSASNSTVRLSPPISTRPLPKYQDLPSTVVQSGPGTPPSAFRVWMTGEGVQYMGDGLTSKTAPAPYQQQRDQLVRSLLWLAQRTGPMRTPTGIPFHDGSGNMIQRRADHAYFSIEGWAGITSGYVRLPITATERGQIEEVVDKIFADEIREHEDALSGKKNSDGIVRPPPGFHVTYAGRRSDEQEGPRVNFAPISLDLAREALVKAIENAMARDRLPPTKNWRADAAAEAKIPLPARGFVTVEGPQGVVKFDVPTGAPGAAHAKLEREAAEAIRQLEKVNRQALVPPTDGTNAIQR